VMMRVDYDPATGEYTENDPRKTRRLDEERRILYVALTRARDRLYVSSPSGSATPHASFAAVANMASAWPECDVELPSQTRIAHRASRVAEVEPQRPEPPEIPAPVVSFTALSSYRTCPRLARYRYRLRLPAIEQIRERETADDGEFPEFALDPAAFGTLIHKALELWGQARIDGEAIAIETALESALRDASGANDADRRKARAVSIQALSVLDDLTFVAAETPFEHEVDGVPLAGVIDAIVEGADGTIDVIDYKTGTLLADEHYALQLDLYARAVRARYPGVSVRARILRLSETHAEWRDAPSLEPGELERLLGESHGFTSDEPRPGLHCASCPYNGSPCHAAPATVELSVAE
jgi:ATP-dependent helicase/nuclease subunit A